MRGREVLANGRSQVHPIVENSGTRNDPPDIPPRDHLSLPIWLYFPGDLVYPVAIEQIVKSVLLSVAHDLSGFPVNGRRKQIRHRPDCEILIVDFIGSPFPTGLSRVDIQGKYRFVIRWHGRFRIRSLGVIVGVTVARGRVEQSSFGIDRG